MGRILWSSEVFNCSAPDTGNMEVLHRYGTREQKEQWLRPLMDGEIRSAFLMTEPDGGLVRRDQHPVPDRAASGNEYVINGRKWWSSGAGDPRCKVAIVMGKTDPERRDPPAAVDDPGAARRADGVKIDAASAGVRLRRRAARPYGGRARRRAGAAVEHAARRGARVRDRAGAARAGAHPPLHADDRRRRGSARGDGASG